MTSLYFTISYLAREGGIWGNGCWSVIGPVVLPGGVLTMRLKEFWSRTARALVVCSPNFWRKYARGVGVV